ncbi:MAG: hypothetical protein ABWX70_06960 [Hyphomicrobium sp.]
MVRSNLPVYIDASRRVGDRLGAHIGDVALLAIRAILKNRRSVEVAHQQIVYRGHHLALSSSITARGDLIVAIDIGDPALAHHLILEDEFRSAERNAREADKKVRDAERKLRRGARRW